MKENVNKIIRIIGINFNFLTNFFRKGIRSKKGLRVAIDRTNYKRIKLIRSIQIDGYSFDFLNIGTRKDILWGVSADKKSFVKIGLNKLDRKKNDIANEAKIIKILNTNQIQSAPMLINSSLFEKNILINSMSSADSERVFSSDHKCELTYLLTEYVPLQKNCLFSDVVLSMIEQKSAGIYHGDVKPGNIRFNNGLAILIDYDQATILDKHIINYNNNEYFEWVSKSHFEQYNNADWLRHFKNVKTIDFERLFKKNAFNIAETSLYRRQLTTNTDQGVYHTILEKDIFAEGIRDLSSRLEALNKINFSDNEEVLDIGCNIGLLSIYLSRRLCKVTGHELDPNIVIAAKIVNNILRNNIIFESHDLDSYTFKKRFDTIMLFSVFHHTKDLIANGKKIAQACNRIIIECRPGERGRKPDLENGKWRPTSVWGYETKKDLYNGLESYFPSFEFYKNYGLVDKGRYIIELRKKL